MSRLVPPLLLSLACSSTVPPLGGVTPLPPAASAADSAADSGDSGGDTAPPVTDADGDGYDALDQGGDDCDDTDPDVHPGATEVWYDGVDSDCDGASDYDADGDGEDAEAYGGTDCDDTDPELQTDCPPPDSLLGAYTLATELDSVDEIDSNLSGITWNPDTGTYMAVLDSARTLFELDPDMAVLREISLTNIDHRDTEDIVYLGPDGDGTPTYAIVTEEGVVYLGTVPDDGATEIDIGGWQMITYNADDAGNSGGEGIAYDADTRTFWVCKEKDPMGVQSFARPTTSDDVSYDDGSLVVTASFDADGLFGAYVTDVSSCMFDPRAGRLLVLSHESRLVLDADLDGTVYGTLDISDAGMRKPEGITLDTAGDMLIAGEPNQWVRYEYGGR